MFDFFKEHFGCLWGFIRVFLLIYAIFSLLVNEDVFTAWLILIGEAINLFLRIYYRWLTSRKSRYYNKEESYWSQRAKEAKEEKEAKEKNQP